MSKKRTVPIPKYDNWEVYEPKSEAPEVNPVDELFDEFLKSDRNGVSLKCKTVRAAVSLACALRRRMYNNRPPEELAIAERKHVEAHFPYHGKVLINQKDDTVYIRRAESNEE